MSRTLVTGATGFVGSAVLRRLEESGRACRALVRPTSDRTNLAGRSAELVEGDLRDSASLRAALAGCDELVHVAADYRLWHPRPAELLAANVEGTRALMEEALDAGVGRVVHTSSVATLGLRDDGEPADEDTPVTEADMIGPYKRSKYLAEQGVLRLVREHGLPAVIVNPSAPMGPRDRRPTPTGRLVLDAAAGRMPAYVDTGLNVVHVDDVARGHVQALERGRAGERYVLGGRNRSLRDILEEVADLTGGPRPRLRLNPGLLLPLAWLSQGWARVTDGPEPRTTVDGLRLARKHMYFSSDKAERELGYRPLETDRAIPDAVDWFLREGRLPRKVAARLAKENG